MKLYQDISVRRAIADIVRPVKEIGIDVFQIREKGKLLQSVTKVEINSFDVPESEELLVDENSNQIFTIVSLSFKEDNKWRLNDGQTTYSVLMNDSDFQRKVDAQEIVFAKNDILAVTYTLNNGRFLKVLRSSVK